MIQGEMNLALPLWIILLMCLLFALLPGILERSASKSLKQSDTDFVDQGINI